MVCRFTAILSILIVMLVAHPFNGAAQELTPLETGADAGAGETKQSVSGAPATSGTRTTTATTPSRVVAVVPARVTPLTPVPAAPGDPLPDEKQVDTSKTVYPADPGLLLELDECVEIAIQRNLNLQIARLTDRASDYSVRIAWAQFFPTFTESILHSNSEGVGGREPSADGNVTLSSNVHQESPWGTKLDFTFDETRQNINAASRSETMALTQPLWRGAGTDANLVNLRSARIRRLINRGNLELDTQNLIFTVRSDYANIIGVLQTREVDREALESAKKFLNFTRARVEAGNQTELDKSQAELQMHQRELNLVTDEAQLGRALDKLKNDMDVDLEEQIRVVVQAINFGDIPPEEMTDDDKTLDVLETDEAKGIVYLQHYNVLRDPKDNKIKHEKSGEPKTIFQAQHFDEVKVLSEALNNRVDLLNNRRALAVQQLQTLAAKNSTGYQVDLVGSYGHTHDGAGVRPLNTTSDINNWTVGLNATVPWGKISDRAAYEQALLNLQQSEISLKSVRTTVHSDVRDIMRTLRQAERTILIDALSVEQAKLTVRATFISFKNGFKDSFEVVTVKDALLQAKNAFIAAMLSYVVDLARLEVVIGRPTGRVDLAGETLGGEILSTLPESLRTKQMPRGAPDAEPSCDDHSHNNSRAYRCDPKPEPDRRLELVPERKPPCNCEIIDSKP